MTLIHILNTENLKFNRSNTICGLVGGTVYDPTKANCETCLTRFKDLYPSSFEAWIRKNNAKV